MATRALIELQGREFRGQTAAESWIRPGVPTHLRRSRGFVNEGNSVYVSTGAGLNGAKAAVFGIALEAVLAAGACGVWLLWRLIH